VTAEPTTRLALLAVRGRLAVALSGARLLRGKREVLATELFRLLREVAAGRSRLDAALREAGRALALARGLDGEEALESLAAAGARDVPVEVETRKVWGLPVHRVSGPRLRREAAARGASPASWGLTAGDAARRHEEALEVLLAIASRELHMERLGEEIQATTRRINALEQVLAPRLRAEAERIASALEERAREEVVRRKRYREARARRS
jgi:V/A-type H+-transporting ATPase subunit D